MVEKRAKRVIVLKVADVCEQIALSSVCGELQVVEFLRDLAAEKGVTLDENDIKKRIAAYERVKASIADD